MNLIKKKEKKREEEKVREKVVPVLLCRELILNSKLSTVEALLIISRL